MKFGLIMYFIKMKLLFNIKYFSVEIFFVPSIKFFFFFLLCFFLLPKFFSCIEEEKNEREKKTQTLRDTERQRETDNE